MCYRNVVNGVECESEINRKTSDVIILLKALVSDVIINLFVECSVCALLTEHNDH
jgi:hypothetical protein